MRKRWLLSFMAKFEDSIIGKPSETLVTKNVTELVTYNRNSFSGYLNVDSTKSMLGSSATKKRNKKLYKQNLSTLI